MKQSKNNRKIGRKKLPLGDKKKVIRVWIKEKHFASAKKQINELVREIEK